MIGIGPRIKVNVVGSAVASSSGAPNITSRGVTYPTPIAPQASGYSDSHPKYTHARNCWSGITPGGSRRIISQSAAAAAARNMREEVAIKVFMGVVMQGSNRIDQIGVSHPYIMFSFMCSIVSQDCLEGLDQIDAHIGGHDLHQMCYDVLQKKWLAWSRGHEVEIAETTLQGTKIFAAISGKGAVRPAKEQDAIWHFVFKKRGKSTKPTFKAEQLELSVVIEYEEFKIIDEYRNNHRPSNGGTITKTTPGLVSKIRYTVISITYIHFSRIPLWLKTWNRFQMPTQNSYGFRMGMMKSIQIKDQNDLDPNALSDQ